MGASKILASAICAIALTVALPSRAEEAAKPGQTEQQAQEQMKKMQAQMPHGPIKTPLGSSPTDVLFSKIAVSDMHKSYEFYTKVIGLKQPVALGQTKGFPAPSTDPKTWPPELPLNFSGSFADPFFDITPAHKPLSRDMTDMIVLGFKVPDAVALVKRVKEAGYEVILEPKAVGPGEMSVGMVRDPDGYRLEILQAASYPPKSP